MEEKLKHLEFIQGVINRMGNNSFLLKGWSVILVSGLFALSTKDSNLSFLFIAYFPAFSYWLLDGYFLWQERLFRKLYDKVRKMDTSDINFSMDTSSFTSKITWFSSFSSTTLIIFHGTIILTVTIIILVNCLFFNP